MASGISVYEHDGRLWRAPASTEDDSGGDRAGSAAARRWLAKVVHGGLRNEDFLQSAPTPPNKLAPLLIGLGAQRLVGAIRMRALDPPPSTSGSAGASCVAMDAVAKPVMLFALAAARSVATANDDTDHDTCARTRQLLLRAPDCGDVFLHQLRQALPRYFRLTAWLQHAELVDHSRWYQVVTTNAAGISGVIGAAHRRLMSEALDGMSAAPQSLSVAEANVVIDELLRDVDSMPLDEDANNKNNNRHRAATKEGGARSQHHTRREMCLRLLHFAAMCGCAARIPELLERAGGRSAAMQNRVLHDMSLVESRHRLETKLLNVVDATKLVQSWRGELCKYGMGPVPLRADIDRTLAALFGRADEDHLRVRRRFWW